MGEGHGKKTAISAQRKNVYLLILDQILYSCRLVYVLIMNKLILKPPTHIQKLKGPPTDLRTPRYGVAYKLVSYLVLPAFGGDEDVDRDEQDHDCKPGKDGGAHGEPEEDQCQDDLQGG